MLSLLEQSLSELQRRHSFDRELLSLKLKSGRACTTLGLSALAFDGSRMEDDEEDDEEEDA